MTSRFRRAVRHGLAAAACGLACMAMVAPSGAPSAHPLDAVTLAQIRSIGLVELPEPEECDVHVFTQRYDGGSFAADAQQLLWIREFSALTAVSKAGLQAAFSEALIRTMAREQGGTPALVVRRLPRPAGVRGVFRHTEAALPTAGTDAVLTLFVRVGYVAFKPESAFKPFVTVRAVLADVASGRLLYDQALTAGQNPSFGDGIQVSAPWPGGGDTSLDSLRKDPAQAAAAWRAALEPLADRLARDFTLPPAATAPLPELPPSAADTPSLGIGAKPLKLRTSASAPLLVRLPASTAPYVVRVAGELGFAADRYEMVTPEVTLLDAQRQPLRRLDQHRAAVRDGRVEQAFYAGPAYPGEAWLLVTPAREAPLARWNYISATTQTIYAGVVTYKNHRFVDLTGPLHASPAGAVEVRADPPVTALR